MEREIRQILLRQPDASLALVKRWDGAGRPVHQFELNRLAQKEKAAVCLLMGDGHDVPRRKMHYALYLYQRFNLCESGRA